jgi:protocatechuate 4,5-dioxygenase beta chain
VLIVFDCDHFSTFFLNNLPTFAIGVAEKTAGPNDHTPMPHYKVPVHAALAAHLRAEGIAAGFDLSLVQISRSITRLWLRLHFLTPRMNIPIVPVFINCFVPPLPSAPRLYLGPGDPRRGGNLSATAAGCADRQRQFLA